MKLTFAVTPDGGETVNVIVGMRDVLRWERTVRGASMGRLAKPAAQDMYSLAWSACKHRGLFDGDLAAFEEQCELEPVEVDEEDPTNPAA